jgi:hypothetical protein
MRKLTYACDSCEDVEYWEEVLKPGFHCECGGHLHLVKTNNFVQISGMDGCRICVKIGTDACIDCDQKT